LLDDEGDFDAYNFPDDEDTQRLLSWMGDDFVSSVGSSVFKGLRRQDPGCELIAIKCEAPPEIKPYVLPGSGNLSSMEVTFKLQVALRASNGQVWRMYTTLYYDVQDLYAPEEAIIRFTLDVEKAIAVSREKDESE
jgi:hypothetical protein